LIGHVAAIVRRWIGEAAKSFHQKIELIGRHQARYHSRAKIAVVALATRVVASPHQCWASLASLRISIDFDHGATGFSRLGSFILLAHTSNPGPFMRDPR